MTTSPATELSAVLTYQGDSYEMICGGSLRFTYKKNGKRCSKGDYWSAFHATRETRLAGSVA